MTLFLIYQLNIMYSVLNNKLRNLAHLKYPALSLTLFSPNFKYSCYYLRSHYPDTCILSSPPYFVGILSGRILQFFHYTGWEMGTPLAFPPSHSQFLLVYSVCTCCLDSRGFSEVAADWSSTKEKILVYEESQLVSCIEREGGAQTTCPAFAAHETGLPSIGGPTRGGELEAWWPCLPLFIFWQPHAFLEETFVCTGAKKMAGMASFPCRPSPPGQGELLPLRGHVDRWVAGSL